MHTFLSNSLPLLERLAKDCDQSLDIALPRGRTRLPCDTFDAACARLAHAASDPAFGLRAAALWHPSDFGVLGYAWFASSTLRAALQRLVRYRRIIGERGELALRNAPEGLWVCYEHHRDSPELNRIGADIVLSILLGLCRSNGGPALVPLALHLRCDDSAQAASYARVFGIPALFGADENAMLFARETVDRELDTANQEVANALDQLLTQQQATLDEVDTVARCRMELLRCLAGGIPSAHEVAHRLCVSERTLQRRLAEHGTNFLALVDETRRDMAMGYLEDPRNSITEVAFLVGFSTPSAFTRAFGRWTGRSPTHWRSAPHPTQRQAA